MNKPKRYLEEKKVIDTINYWWRTAIIADGQPTLCDEIRALPTADVKPVVHGKWIHGHCGVDDYIRCSKCGREVVQNIATLEGDLPEYAFTLCPFCGADMRGGEDGSN